jgi:hypothetical protein
MDNPAQNPDAGLPLSILKVPLDFYGLSADPKGKRSSEAIEKLSEYVDQLTAELKVQIGNIKDGKITNVSTELLRATRTMPAALFRLPDDCEIPIPLFSILHEHIYYVYRTHQKTPDPHLAAMLVGYPEYVYYLMQNEGLPDGTLDEAQQTTVRSLLPNPPWTIKWLEQYYRQGKLSGFPEVLFKELLNSLYNLHDHDGTNAHCYHWLKTRTDTYEAKTAEMAQLLAAIGTNPFIAIITAREFPKLDVEPLLVEVQESPMWSYHWLRYVERGRTTKMIQNLINWIPWGVQYIHDQKPAEAKELLAQMKFKQSDTSNQRNPWWTKWLEDYNYDPTKKPQAPANRT